MAYLHHRGAEHADIDHIAFDTAELHAVTGAIKAAEHHGKPARHRGDDLLQGEGNARTGHAQSHGKSAELVTVHHHDQHQHEQVARYVEELPHAVLGVGLLRPAGEAGLEEFHQRPDQRHADHQPHDAAHRGVQ